MMGYSTITQKGQVTLPVGVRRALGLEVNQRVMIIRDGDGARITPAADFMSMAGSFASSKPFNIRAMRKAAKEKLADSYGKKTT